jgi:ADP-ribose pyrophosphatase
MAGLTEEQTRALDAYETLMSEQPGLFVGRTARPIVQDREVLEAYAAENDVILGVAADTRYVLFLVDLVESRLPDGGVQRHPYLRVVSRAQLQGGVNVVVLATIADSSLGPKGSIVLVDQERHALGTCETELPRGFGEHGLSGETNALRELEDETGFVGDHAELLGVTNTDTGVTDAKVSFYHVPVVRRTAARPEIEEAIGRVRLVAPDELWKLIRSGDIRDSFTLQALALFERRARI